MNWIPLNNESQLLQIKEESKDKPVIIFKHSTTCSISAMAKNRLDREKHIIDVMFYYLDLLKYRGISNQIAEEFNITHQSPQILLIKNGACTYTESHNGINMADIESAIIE